MTKSWHLEEAQTLFEEQPTTFTKPSKQALEPLEKGHKAKLSFKFDNEEPGIPSSEHLWIEILMVDRNKLLGQLEDDPKYIQDLQRGEIIEFEERHILYTD